MNGIKKTWTDFERIKVSFDCGNILDFLHLAEFCVAFYEKKNPPARPGKITMGGC